MDIVVQILINVVPTVIMYFILLHSKRWIDDDLERARDVNIQGKVIESFAISYIGFAVLTSITSLYIEPQSSVNQMATPIIYVYAVFFSPVFEELICRKVIQDN